MGQGGGRDTRQDRWADKSYQNFKTDMQTLNSKSFCHCIFVVHFTIQKIKNKKMLATGRYQNLRKLKRSERIKHFIFLTRLLGKFVKSPSFSPYSAFNVFFFSIHMKWGRAFKQVPAGDSLRWPHCWESSKHCISNCPQWQTPALE